MGNTRTQYQIDLIVQSDQARQAVFDIERSLKSISDSAKDGLSDGLSSANDKAKALAEQIKNIDLSSEGATEQFEAFGKAADKTVKDLEKQAVQLNFALSDEGKQLRQNIENLQREKESLGNTTREKKRAKEIEKEIANLQKQVVYGSDEELKNALKNNVATRATLRLAQQDAKLRQAQVKSSKTMAQLFKADLKLMQEKIKAQFKFIDALKTTEGRYKAIKKAAGMVGSGARKMAGMAAKGAAIAGGGLLDIGGMAMASAESQVDREKEVDRIKAGRSRVEKAWLLTEAYKRTGKDYTTIVDAINRVSNAIGPKAKPNDLLQGTLAELRYPGASKLLLQQNTSLPDSGLLAAFANKMQAVQGVTGASVEQIQSTADKVSNMRQSNFSNASISDLMSLYLGLQSSGAFDTEDELDRAFNSFIMEQRNSDKNIFDLAKDWQASGKWTRTAYGGQNITQATNAIANVDFGALEKASGVNDTKYRQTDAEKTASKLREIEEAKNELLRQLVEALAPVFKEIPVSEIANFFKGLIKTTIPLITSIKEGITDIIKVVKDIYNKMPFVGNEPEVSGHARAAGGIVSMPSLVGEAGPEMVVPLDYSRSTRGRQLTQNLTQYFNLSGNETTALSLSQAVKSRDFSRAMASNSYINGRLGR
jgi:hypothetical protein